MFWLQLYYIRLLFVNTSFKTRAEIHSIRCKTRDAVERLYLIRHELRVFQIAFENSFTAKIQKQCMFNRNFVNV